MEPTLTDLADVLEINFPYTTNNVAKYINHPKITGVITLRRFLRKEGLMRGDSPTEFAIENGYMKVQRCCAHNLGMSYDKIMVSPSGLDFIEKLIDEKLGIRKVLKIKLFNQKDSGK